MDDQDKNPDKKKATSSWVAAISRRAGMHYDTIESGKRDLRIDFMRGLVMVILVCVHIEIFSLFNFLVWERLGLISGAEGFVLLSGIVLGVVHKRIEDPKVSTMKLLARSTQLYRITLAVGATIVAFSLLNIVDFGVLKTFVNHSSGEVYQLFPQQGAPLSSYLFNLVTLKSSPHQFQVMGLYVLFIAVTPLILWLLRQNCWRWVIGMSWVLYVSQIHSNERLFNMQFEYAFSILAWQILYLHGLVIGYHQEDIKAFAAKTAGKAVVSALCVLALGFFFIAQNTTNPSIPEWSTLDLIPSEWFSEFRYKYFDKNQLGVLRFFNWICFLTLAYVVLTRFWGAFKKAFGWLLIPLGQASLYVFILHLVAVLIVSLLPGVLEQQLRYSADTLLLNTVIHATAIMLLWLAVKKQFMFKYIPR